MGSYDLWMFGRYEKITIFCFGLELHHFFPAVAFLVGHDPHWLTTLPVGVGHINILFPPGTLLPHGS